MGEGQHAASWIDFTNADGTTQPGLCLFELSDADKIVRITDLDEAEMFVLLSLSLGIAAGRRGDRVWCSRMVVILGHLTTIHDHTSTPNSPKMSTERKCRSMRGRLRDRPTTHRAAQRRPHVGC